MSALSAFYLLCKGRLQVFRRKDGLAVGELDSLGKVGASALLEDAMREKSLVDRRGNRQPLTEAEHSWLKSLMHVLRPES